MVDPKNDIEKYLKGELSQAEMHKLEMRALHDPFLADALEGADLTTPEQFAEDVNFLNQRIQNKKTKRYYWPLRIAASVLLIISVTYLIFQVNPKNSNQSLALKKENKKEEAVTSSEPDSIKRAKDNSESNESKQAIVDKPIAKPKTTPKEIAKNNQVPLPTSEVLKETITSMPLAELEATELEAVTEDISPITRDVTILENEEVAQLKTEARRSKSDALKKSASPSSLSGASNKEMKSSLSNSITARSVIEKEDYQNYLKDNVQYPKEAIDNKITGEVIVSFLVDVDAALSDFIIEKGIGFGCDQELVRLIKLGPTWAPALENGTPVAGRASVSFFFDPQN